MRIGVFCGSKEGKKTIYKELARCLGVEFAENNISLVYGGSSTGIMGVVADAVLDGGGEVIGVIPEPLFAREIAHQRLTELRRVKTMHERKAQMYDLSDGFIILPGGIGTLEEFFEVFTWYGIGEEKKPCGILNVDHYYDPLIKLLDHMVEEGFLTEELREVLIIEESSDELVKQLKNKIEKN